jgi:cation diffusion facilitator family transporter
MVSRAGCQGAKSAASRQRSRCPAEHGSCLGLHGNGGIVAAVEGSQDWCYTFRMAHYRKPLAAAAALNTAIFVVEAVAGFQADSLSLIMDSVHNLSDEMALVFLYLAFVLPHGVSRHLLRSANLFNSVGLVLVSALLLWQAVERIVHPAPVVGSVAVVVGLLAAAANWGIARLLLAASRNNAAIRLAYIHNIGDVYVSLAPVAAGLLISLTGYSIFDPLIAAAIATWIIVSTMREVFGSSEELIWPEKIVCGHSDHEDNPIVATPSRP